jgi:putative exporter of polyketide antibiotics
MFTRYNVKKKDYIFRKVMKIPKSMILLAGVIVVLLVLASNGSLSSKNNKMAQNAEVRDLFQQRATSTENHQRSAEKSFIEKYFDVKF